MDIDTLQVEAESKLPAASPRRRAKAKPQAGDALLVAVDEQRAETFRRLSGMAHVQAVIERARISAANQNRTLAAMDPQILVVTARVEETLRELEEFVETEMEAAVKKHPVWPWLKKVKGVQLRAASLLLGYLLPPTANKGPSSWYKAAGLYPVEVECRTCGGVGFVASGRAPVAKRGRKPVVERSEPRAAAAAAEAADAPSAPSVDGATVAGSEPEECGECEGTGNLWRLPRYDHLPDGEKAYWHPQIRRNLYVVGTCLVRGGGFYYEWFRVFKQAFLTKHPRWAAGMPKALRPGDQAYLDELMTTLNDWGVPNALRYILELGSEETLTAFVEEVRKQMPAVSEAVLLKEATARVKYLEKLLLVYLRTLVPIDRLFREAGSAEEVTLLLSHGGRAHAVAFWRMVKLFLSHLWEEWCRAEGIPFKGAYPIEVLGHAGIIESPSEGG